MSTKCTSTKVLLAVGTVIMTSKCINAAVGIDQKPSNEKPLLTPKHRKSSLTSGAPYHTHIAAIWSMLTGWKQSVSHSVLTPELEEAWQLWWLGDVCDHQEIVVTVDVVAVNWKHIYYVWWLWLTWLRWWWLKLIDKSVLLLSWICEIIRDYGKLRFWGVVNSLVHRKVLRSNFSQQ